MTTPFYTDKYLLALDRAATWHITQPKKGPETPYISHLLTVSALVWDDQGSETEAIAALLHDAVEDEGATLDQVRELFGPEVADIVDHCSDAAPMPGESKPPWFHRKTEHVEKLRTLASHPENLPTTRVVAADKLANVRSILVDHRGGHGDLWGRFKGGLGGSVWYYSQMAAIVGSSIPDSMLARELRTAVGDLTTVMTDITAGFGGHDRTIAEALGDIAIDRGSDATDHLAFELSRRIRLATTDPEAAIAKVLSAWFGAHHGSDDVSVRVLATIAA